MPLLLPRRRINRMRNNCLILSALIKVKENYIRMCASLIVCRRLCLRLCGRVSKFIKFFSVRARACVCVVRVRCVQEGAFEVRGEVCVRCVSFYEMCECLCFCVALCVRVCVSVSLCFSLFVCVRFCVCTYEFSGVHQ